jgi:hypothetical protein
MDNGWPFEIFTVFPPTPLGYALHFVIFAPDPSIALVFALSGVLFCDWNSFSRSYENCKFIPPMVDICVTSVIQTRTAPELQAVRLFHNVRARNAGSQRCT